MIKNKRAKLKIIGLLTFFPFFSATHAQPIVSIPYSDESRVPVIVLMANGEKHNFIVDFGAEVTILNAQFIPLAGNRKAKAKDANNNAKEISRGELTSLVFGDNRELALSNLDVYVADIQENAFKCHAIAGILGMDILGKYIIELDPGKKLFNLHQVAGNTVDQLDASFERLTLSPKNKRPVIVAGVNGQDLSFLLDSGSSGFIRIPDNGGFEFDHTLSQKFSGYSAIGIHGRREDLINSEIITGDVVIGGIANKQVPLLIEPTNSCKLGFSFLKQYHLFLSPKNGKVALKKINDTVVEDMLTKFGFSIGTDQDRYVIAKINTTRKNLKVGDKVVAVNAIALNDVCALDKVRALINQLEMPVVLTIEASDQTITEIAVTN